MNPRRPAAFFLVSVALGTIMLSGCKTPAPPPAQRADYTQTLNKYYEGRPLCLWQDTVTFPLQASEEQVEQLGLEALVQAGLLTSRPAGKGGAKGTATFSLTEAGRAALTPDVFKQGAGNFCYGRRKVISVDAARRNSSTTELVDYHYGIPEPAAWASNPAVETAFPGISTEIAGPRLGEVTLLDTTDGWEVSGTPANINSLARRKRPSPLAKARSLLHLKKKSTS